MNMNCLSYVSGSGAHVYIVFVILQLDEHCDHGLPVGYIHYNYPSATLSTSLSISSPKYVYILASPVTGKPDSVLTDVLPVALKSSSANHP